MTWKQIIRSANYIIYSITGGIPSKSSIGFIEYQEKMSRALSIHQRITWAYLDDDKETALEELNTLKQFDESPIPDH